MPDFRILRFRGGQIEGESGVWEDIPSEVADTFEQAAMIASEKIGYGGRYLVIRHDCCETIPIGSRIVYERLEDGS